MTRRISPTLGASIALVFVLLSTSVIRAEEPTSFSQAQQMAKDSDKLLLVDFFAEWCGPCKHFQADAQSSAPLKESLQRVVFLSIDAEKGEGVELAKRYGVRSYPNYLLMDAQGAPVYRWVGYGTAESFIQQLDKGLADPTTLAEKEARFEKNPTAEDAVVLANAAAAASDQKDAAMWYEKASELAGGGYEMEIFYTKFYGLRSGSFTPDEVVAAADRVMADGSEQEKFQVYAAQPFLAKATGNDSLAYRYVESFWNELKDNQSDDPDVKRMRQRVELDHALYIEKDRPKAAQLKYDSMPEGWMDDADGLNEYAWWCFENQVDLKRAERLGRKAIEIAAEGKQKAAVLDTVAQICNLRGKTREAVELAEQAMQNDPSAYYSKQLEQFRAMLQESQ